MTDLPGTDTVGDDGFCDFAVTVTYVSNQKSKESTGPDGSIQAHFTGYAQATVTSASRSLDYTISGPGTVTTYPSGAFTIDAAGPNLLWTTVKNSYSGVPQLAYSTGRVQVSVLASGITESYKLNGRSTDVCEALS